MKAYEQIGRKLQKAREDAGLSQEELARKLGCSQASLSNYELGKRRLYLADLQRIGQLLGKPVTYFLEESENDEPIGKDLASILEEPYVRETLLALRDLNPAQRKSVFDYILWQRSGGNRDDFS
jgi:transcriptional regulator with XRE-family HTH domain